jgi:hypothetical protein
VPYTLEYSAVFGDTMSHAATVNTGRFDIVRLSMAVAKFIDWKKSGIISPPPFTDDKWSGYRPDGTVFQPYVSGKYRHCHLDICGTEPLLAYRQWDADQRIRLICITSHREMFQRNESGFFQKFGSLGPGRQI